MDRKEVVSMSGVKSSMYLGKNETRLLRDLTIELGTSSSKVISHAIRTESMLQRAKVFLSEGACIALAKGRFDLLVDCGHVTSDGLRLIVAKESAIHPLNDPGATLAKEKAELLEYLSPSKESVEG